MKESMVSIIIPAYNAEHCIRTCLLSVLHQQYNSIECIVINDGSKDKTGEEIQLFLYDNADQIKEKGIKFKIMTKDNGGVSSARNTGIEVAEGDWVCFIDVDDRISDDYIISSDFIQDSELILKRVFFSNSTDEYLPLSQGKREGYQLKDFLESYIYTSKFLTPWAKFFKRDILLREEIRFNKKYKFGEDTLFVVKYLRNVNSIFITDKGYYHYTISTFNKYNFPVDTAIEYMHDFAKIYFDLNITCPEMVKRILIWHSGFTTDFHDSNKWKWYTDPIVNKLYRYSSRCFNIQMRLKIIIFSFFTLVKNLIHGNIENYE